MILGSLHFSGFSGSRCYTWLAHTLVDGHKAFCHHGDLNLRQGFDFHQVSTHSCSSFTRNHCRTANIKSGPKKVKVRDFVLLFMTLFKEAFFISPPLTQHVGVRSPCYIRAAKSRCAVRWAIGHCEGAGIHSSAYEDRQVEPVHWSRGEPEGIVWLSRSWLEPASRSLHRARRNAAYRRRTGESTPQPIYAYCMQCTI